MIGAVGYLSLVVGVHPSLGPQVLAKIINNHVVCDLVSPFCRFSSTSEEISNDTPFFFFLHNVEINVRACVRV